jgi:hypothetical protein
MSRNASVHETLRKAASRTSGDLWSRHRSAARNCLPIGVFGNFIPMESAPSPQWQKTRPATSEEPLALTEPIPFLHTDYRYQSKPTRILRCLVVVQSGIGPMT